MLLMQGEKKQNNQGMSLVEVLCAVAIFSLVAAVVAGVVTVSARIYRSGVTDTTLQQQAQYATNLIGNLIKDANTVKSSSSDTYTILTSEDTGYVLQKDSANQSIIYYRYTGGAADTAGAETLVDNVEDFTMDCSDFEKTRAVKLSLKMKNGEKEYSMDYTMTARNEVVQDIDFSTVASVNIECDSEVYMVPGETWQLPITVSGETGGITIKCDDGVTTDSLQYAQNNVPDYISLTLDKGVTASEKHVTIESANKSGGTSVAQKVITIKVRRVNKITVSHKTNISNTTNHTLEEKGTVFTFYAKVDAYNSAKRYGKAYDNNWKQPSAVYWSAVMTIDDSPVSEEEFAQYFKQVDIKEDIGTPMVQYEVLQDMPAGTKLTVTATSKHRQGVNKGGETYYTTEGKDEDITGTDFVEARDTKIDDTAIEVTLEPNEDYSFPLNMLGGTKLVMVNFTTETQPTDSKTTIKYDTSDGKVKLHIGNDEKGSGYPSTVQDVSPYTLIAQVYLNGEVAKTITIHIRRVDAFSMVVKDEWYDDDTHEVMNEAAYQFRVRFNSNDGTKQKEALTYLVNDSYSEWNAKTLAVYFEWVLKDESSGDTYEEGSGSVICLGDGTKIDKDGKKIQKYSAKNKYFSISEVKASITTDENGEIKVDEPHINIHPTDSVGLPDGSVLTVKATLLHNLGETTKGEVTASYNKTGIQYSELMSAEASIRGSRTLKVPTDYVIAEPGQGTDEATPSEQELVIPITVEGGAVYKIEAKITGNSSEDTRLSKYPDGINNPYTNNQTDAGNTATRTWWLGLHIGTDETGKEDSGVFDINLTAYNSRGKAVGDSVTVHVALRRVKQVNISVNKKVSGVDINDVNKANEKITLYASPAGYGDDDGTQYFAIQKDEDGNVCRWETENHGKYKPPYPVKWTMTYKGEEKSLDEWTEYFTAVSTQSQDENQTVTFTLLKVLPDGAEIHATSLHARGTVDDVSYNKSGKEYGKVVGVLKIGQNGSVPILVEFQRGHDGNTFAANFPNHRQDGNDIDAQAIQRGFFRYRESGGSWSGYYKLSDNSETPAKFDRNESSIFDLDKAYDVEVIVAVYNPNKHILYWPRDTKLLDTINATEKEYGITWTKGWSGADDTEVSEYSRSFSIGKAKLVINNVTPSADSDGVISRNAGEDVSFDVDVKLFSFLNWQGSSKASVQKLNGDTWEDVKPDEYGISIQDSAPRFIIRSTAGKTSGTFRIGVTLQTDSWKTVTGSMLDTKYTDKTIYTVLSDFDSGNYIQITYK